MQVIFEASIYSTREARTSRFFKRSEYSRVIDDPTADLLNEQIRLLMQDLTKSLGDDDQIWEIKIPSPRGYGETTFDVLHIYVGTKVQIIEDILHALDGRVSDLLGSDGHPIIDEMIGIMEEAEEDFDLHSPEYNRWLHIYVEEKDLQKAISWAGKLSYKIIPDKIEATNRYKVYLPNLEQKKLFRRLISGDDPYVILNQIHPARSWISDLKAVTNTTWKFMGNRGTPMRPEFHFANPNGDRFRILLDWITASGKTRSYFFLSFITDLGEISRLREFELTDPEKIPSDWKPILRTMLQEVKL